MTDYLHALPSGYRIEEYELVRVLGSGGFGITYLGYDHHLDKAVAIKEYLPNDLAVRTDNQSVLPKSTQDRADYEWGLERFLNEAQTLARFDHRHIIKIHRFFRAHGTGYSVMEYAEGETLSALLQRKGTLTEVELKQVLFPILDGLEAVHQADFLHRDIKPGNIVIRDDGSPVLIDFGSARQAVAGKSRSVTAIVTPGYAPIEQYSAKGHQGPWTDIYGLGAVCYRCLTGEVPNDATERLRADPLVPASKRCKGKASVSLLDSIDLALRVHEGERPQTIAAWRKMLSNKTAAPAYRWKKDTVKPTARPSAPFSLGRRASLWSKLLLAGVVVALVGGAVYWERQNELLPDEFGSDIALSRGTSATGEQAAQKPEEVEHDSTFTLTPVIPVGSELIPVREAAGEMVSIPGGTFRMGDLSGEISDIEKPAHTVTVRPFNLGKYEVTYAQYDVCVADGGCKYKPRDAWGSRGNRPVIYVSWDDVQVFVDWLNGKTRSNYRLPTEAEWEYAARAGTTTEYSWGNDIGEERAAYAVYGFNLTGPEQVGSFPANAWGLHDMHGNVSEWVQDCWNYNYAEAPSDGSAWESGNCDERVIRGGSKDSSPYGLRSACRTGTPRTNRYDDLGFRLAQDM